MRGQPCWLLQCFTDCLVAWALVPLQDSLADLQQWAASSGSRGVAALAGGLNPANIHSSGQPDGVQQSEADDVAAFLRQISVDGPLLVISASQLLGPQFRLQRIVQHALVRGLDCVCYTAHMPRPETAEGTPQAVLHFLDDSINPQARNAPLQTPSQLSAQPLLLCTVCSCAPSPVEAYLRCR